MKMFIEDIGKTEEVKRAECNPPDLLLGFMDGMNTVTDMLSDVSRISNYPESVKNFAATMSRNLRNNIAEISNSYLSRLEKLDNEESRKLKIIR